MNKIEKDNIREEEFVTHENYDNDNKMNNNSSTYLKNKYISRQIENNDDYTINKGENYMLERAINKKITNLNKSPINDGIRPNENRYFYDFLN